MDQVILKIDVFQLQQQSVADAQVRDLDGVIQKLNTTYQQELKDEMEAENFFIN